MPTRPSRHSRPTHPVRTFVAAITMVALTVTGCYRYSTDQNTIVAGNIGYVYFKKIATDQAIDLLHYRQNHDSEGLTLTQMKNWTKSRLFTSQLGQIGFYLSDFDYFFSSPTQNFDFGEAAYRVRGTNRCLVMHRNLNPGLPWGDPPDRHNWTYREDADRYCTNGKGYV